MKEWCSEALVLRESRRELPTRSNAPYREINGNEHTCVLMVKMEQSLDVS